MTGQPMNMHWFNTRTGEALRISVDETREMADDPSARELWLIYY